MNFIKLYIGDYLRDTGTLSVAEHGAYMLMLLHHYATEKPLPEGRELHRLIRAETKVERDAADSVLARFWTKTETGWVNARAAKEFERADAVSETNREIAVRREAAKRAKREHEQSTKRAPSVHEQSTNGALHQTSRQIPSEANASGGKPPPATDRDLVFANGVTLLTAAGVAEKNARSFLAGACKTHGEGAVLAALQACAQDAPIQPIPWLQAVLANKPRQRKVDALMAGNIAAAQRYLESIGETP